MARTIPDLLVLVEGDPSRVYRSGDKVKGKVVLVLEQEEQVKSFKISFIGGSITRTTRPFYVTGESEHAHSSARKEYKERADLFNHEILPIEDSAITTGKHSYPFEFTFPDLTEPRHSRWTHGPKYSKGPHALPPSFHINTNHPGGKASISYFVLAKLVVRTGRITKARQTLNYQPSIADHPLEARLTSRVLYGQTLKPFERETGRGTAVDKVMKKISNKATAQYSSPQIVPILRYPDQVTPGQSMPISLALKSLGHSTSEAEQPECILDSFTMVLSTITTTICGRLLTQPQDTVIKDVTCVARSDINTPIAFDTPTKLTTNLRLVDDDEAVPSFKSYIISRHYTITATIGIKCNSQTYTVRTVTPLHILPRDDRIAAAAQQTVDQDGVPHEPLPLYAPREPSSEEAPDYEEVMRIMSSSTGASTPGSSSSELTMPYDSSSDPSTPWSIGGTDDEGYGFPRMDTPPTEYTTPVEEMDGFDFDEGADEESGRGRNRSWIGRAARRVFA